MSNRAKNIVVFLTLSFLLTSCFNNTEEVVEDTTNDVNVEQTIDDINAEVDALEEEVNNKMEEANEAINNALDEANNAMDEVSEATGIDTPKVVKLDTVYTTPGGDHNITFVVNTMGDKITSVNVTSDADHEVSQKLIGMFSDAVNGAVEGKTLEEAKNVDVIGGASLTTGAFTNALKNM